MPPGENGISTCPIRTATSCRLRGHVRLFEKPDDIVLAGRARVHVAGLKTLKARWRDSVLDCGSRERKRSIPGRLALLPEPTATDCAGGNAVRGIGVNSRSASEASLVIRVAAVRRRR